MTDVLPAPFSFFSNAAGVGKYFSAVLSAIARQLAMGWVKWETCSQRSPFSNWTVHSEYVFKVCHEEQVCVISVLIGRTKQSTVDQVCELRARKFRNF